MSWLIRTLTLLYLLSLTVGDDTVSCLFSEDCVLPCKSIYHDIIHWQKVNGEILHVHSYFKDANQMDHQNQAYKGRTSLFSDQITNGNLSLILRDVKTQDSGRYKCYTASSTKTQEAFVTMNVKAPVKSVDIHVTDEVVTCNTSKVYPKPKIYWYIDGTQVDPVTMETPNDNQSLFSLISTIKTQPAQNKHNYSCSIQFKDGSQTYTASLSQEKSDIDLGHNLTIHCPRGPGHFTLILTFNKYITILSYDSQTSQPVTTKQWNGADVSVTPEGNVVLQNLDSEKHSGTYTCEWVSGQSRHLQQTSVQINPGLPMIAIIVGAAAGVVVVIAAIIAGVCSTRKAEKKKANGTTYDKAASS